MATGLSSKSAWLSGTDWWYPDVDIYDTMIATDIWMSGGGSVTRYYNWGISPTLKWGNWGGEYYYCYLLIYFDLPELPEGAAYSQSWIYYRLLGEGSLPGVVEAYMPVHHMFVQWWPGLRNGAEVPPTEDGSSWYYRNRKGSLRWGGDSISQGNGDFGYQEGYGYVYTGDPHLHNGFSLGLTDFYSSSPPAWYGVVVPYERMSTTLPVQFASAEHSNAAYRPYLVFRLTYPDAPKDKWSYKHAYVFCGTNDSSSASAFCEGANRYALPANHKSAYLAGGSAKTSSKYAYLNSGTDDSSSSSAYTGGAGPKKSKKRSYTAGIVRSTQHAYIEATF